MSNANNARDFSAGGHREADPYWWEQSSSSSKNLMDAVEGGLWDELFQDKATTSFTVVEQWENKLCLKEEDDDADEKRGEGDDGRNHGEQSGMSTEMSGAAGSPRSESESLSATSAPTTHNAVMSADNAAHKFSSSQITENSSSLRESNTSQALSDMTIHLDYARLKTEHRKLKKIFENAYENRYKTPPVSETVRRLSRAEPVALDLYRSHRDKMELLKEALEECDWDGVITVLLFIKRTLSNALFRQCLMEHPKAAQHYVTYLRECGDNVELVDTLFGLGQTAEAAMVEFVSACKWTDPKRKLEALRNCLLSGFSHPQLASERRSLQEWITLLETHLKMPS